VAAQGITIVDPAGQVRTNFGFRALRFLPISLNLSNPFLPTPRFEPVVRETDFTARIACCLCGIGFDPPYGVEYDPAWRNQTGAAKTKRTGKVLNDDRADWREAWSLFPGDVAYVWHGALHAATVAESLEAAGFNVRSQIIWAKDRLVLSRGDYHWQHEPCWYAVKKTGKGHWAGDRKQTTLWQIANKDQDADTVHGTQKPVECMRRPILNNSSQGQAVYEPFMGSGTTLIAAETTGRVCHGIELNPAYVDVAVERWQQFTGQAATLDGTDQTFAELADKKLPPIQDGSDIT